MKHFKKVILIFGLLFVLAVFILPNILLFGCDYASISIVNKNDSYITLNNSQKYCYMPYYNYKSEPDLKIIDVNNITTSFLNPYFFGYSDDLKNNFLYCKHGSFGIQTVGLYVNETSLDDLFEASLNNIHRIVICDVNNIEQLVFDLSDETLFNLFLEYYFTEINNCFFPKNVTDKNVFNGDYSIYIEYLNGKISRFLKCINISEFEMWAQYK